MNQEEARKILIEHSRSVKNGIFPESITHDSKITNPICGDHVELKIACDQNEIKKIGFKAVACAICTASTSLLCKEVEGLTTDKALELAGTFETSVLEPQSCAWPVELSRLQCFEHLRVNPSRKACALLPWVALKKAFMRPV
ncbi:MAG: iron-sulfur cluster assembly scaffold protein [Bacteriovoracaceae bacterium]|nr:iron-sulfur cluster assembly scaffold protein [Bacteriovoracaceae bacterium]